MSLLKRILYGIGGVFCLLLGFIMLFTPGPGIAFIILGLVMLSSVKIPFIDSLIEKIKRKFNR